MYYIYLIVNKVNGKTYVGQRKSSKKWYEDKYMGSGKLLKPAKKKYGIENFEKFLIQYCYSKEETDKAEKFWIAEYRRRGKAEYNIADGGQGGNLAHAWNKGKKLSDEHKKKLSEAHKGKSVWNKGKPCSEETKKKISEANTGRHHTDEVKRKMSEQRKGKHHSEEWTRKISESNKGRRCSEETKKRISETLKGRRLSEETIKKMRESNKGKNKGRPSPRKGKHWKLVDGKRVWY